MGPPNLREIIETTARNRWLDVPRDEWVEGVEAQCREALITAIEHAFDAYEKHNKPARSPIPVLR